MMVARIHGSSMWSITLPSGMSTGLCSSCTSPLVRWMRYTTDGAVAIRSRSNSRVSRSWMISRCSSPRKPQRKPKPSAAEVSGFVVEAGIVQPQPAQRFAQLLEVVGVHRIEAAPHHRHRRLEPGQRLGRRRAVVGDRVAHRAVGHRLDRGGDVADLAGAEVVDRDHLRAEHAHLLDLVHRRPWPSCGCAGRA